MRCVARRALAHVPTLSTYHLHQNLSHNAISSVEALGTASPDCFVTPESTSDRAAFSSRIKCGPKFGNLTTLDISHNALHSLLGAIRWKVVSSSELQFRVFTGKTYQSIDPPDIRMPVGFGASLSFLNATSNPRLLRSRSRPEWPRACERKLAAGLDRSRCANTTRTDPSSDVIPYSTLAHIQALCPLRMRVLQSDIGG